MADKYKLPWRHFSSSLLKKEIFCFGGLSMNGNLSMNSKQPPFALSLVEG
jgi:hypothetical protein